MEVENRRSDFEKIKTALKEPVIFDGRNLYDRKVMKRLEIEYHAIGRMA